MKSNGNKIESAIVEKAKELGASLAGIARIEDLKASNPMKYTVKTRSTKHMIPNHRIILNLKA